MASPALFFLDWAYCSSFIHVKCAKVLSRQIFSPLELNIFKLNNVNKISIQGYIFDNSVLLVKLMAVKMRSENIALLRLMAIVFNPTSKLVVI